jgi:23S rRNA (guanosine2251-2'-O)-methyltransferase
LEKIFGINSVSEILKSDMQVELVYVLSSKRDKLSDIIQAAKSKGTPVKFVPQDFFKNTFDAKNHQGVAAVVSKISHPVITEEELLNTEGDVNIVLLDGITDPHNLGAIIRTCDVFEVDAVVLPKDNSAKINDTVFKTSSGAASYVPSCIITNISNFLLKARDTGFWIYGLDVEGDKPLRDEDFSRRNIIVVGSEGKGMRRLVKERCDFLLSIPTAGHVDSLNASNACAVTLYELYMKTKA